MINYLSGSHASGRGLDYLTSIPEFISAVNTDSMKELMTACVGHEVFTVLGPLEYTETAAKNLGLDYEIVDWDALYQEQLTEKELKKHLKSKEKWLKKKAEAEAKKAAESSKDSPIMPSAGALRGASTGPSSLRTLYRASGPRSRGSAVHLLALVIRSVTKSRSRRRHQTASPSRDPYDSRATMPKLT